MSAPLARGIGAAVRDGVFLSRLVWSFSGLCVMEWVARARGLSLSNPYLVSCGIALGLFAYVIVGRRLVRPRVAGGTNDSVEAMGRTLTATIVERGTRCECVERLRAFAREGNVDRLHFEATWWLWVWGNYTRDWKLLNEVRALFDSRMSAIVEQGGDITWLRYAYHSWRLLTGVSLGRYPHAESILPPESL